MEIVILDSGYQSYDYERELFGKNGFYLIIYPSYEGDPSEKRAFAKNADGMLVRHTRIDRSFLSEMKKLKAIVRYGVGYDNIDVAACTESGIKVANVQGYANHAVSEHAMALMLSCTRAMWNTRLQLEDKFAKPPVKDIFELHDKTLGIIGIGRIGTEFCKKASGLFKQVLACDPYKPEHHFDKLSAERVVLDELLEKSDVISLHCNLTDETRYLLNKDKFLIMKKRPVIINTSRGEVISEEALLKALNAGIIHSAGLDVFENEPVTEKQSKLISHPRVICTGHYAWYSDKSAVELQRRAANNLLNLLKGNPVEDCLNG
jgi:D-3-phosphoglycerate dehydrogenase